jgi:hypothetical protein
VDRSRGGLPKCSSSTSAYCQARQRLPVGLIKDLTLLTSSELEMQTPDRWRWKGRSVKLIDGSTLSMPDTEANQKEWPQHGQQDEGVGFPIMRIVAIMSLATAAVIDFAFGSFQGKGSGELSLARQLLGSLQTNDILLADHYYCSYFFICMLRERGIDLVARQHGARYVDFRLGHHFGPGDHMVELIKPPKPQWMDQDTYERMPKNLKLREVKTRSLDDEGKEIVIATTITDPGKYSRTEIAAFSKMRWNVELDLRSLKTVMGMDILSCKTPAMIEKEIWAYILVYNLVRQLIAKAAFIHGLEPRQISYTGALGAFTAFLPLFDGNYPPEAMRRFYDSMLEMIASYRIGNRPGRKEPRAVKRRPKPVPYLKTTRAEARNSKSP